MPSFGLLQSSVPSRLPRAGDAMLELPELPRDRPSTPLLLQFSPLPPAQLFATASHLGTTAHQWATSLHLCFFYAKLLRWLFGASPPVVYPDRCAGPRLRRCRTDAQWPSHRSEAVQTPHNIASRSSCRRHCPSTLTTSSIRVDHRRSSVWHPMSSIHMI
jgi:hypothetical protein